MKPILLTILVLLFSGIIYAECAPPQGEMAVDCPACGDLEYNPQRAFDTAMNALLDHPAIKLQLLAYGGVTVHLGNLGHATNGNTFYTVTIRDPGWSITNGANLAHMRGIVGRLTTGINLSLPPGASVDYAAQTVQNLTQGISASISHGTDDYALSLYSNEGGLALAEQDRDRFSPRSRTDDVVYDPVAVSDEKAGNSQYAKSDCRDDVPDNATDTPVNGSNDEYDSSDRDGMADAYQDLYRRIRCGRGHVSDGYPYIPSPLTCIIT